MTQGCFFFHFQGNGEAFLIVGVRGEHYRDCFGDGGLVGAYGSEAGGCLVGRDREWGAEAGVHEVELGRPEGLVV